MKSLTSNREAGSNKDAGRERVRVYAVGTCPGLDELLEALARHDDVELLGSSKWGSDAASALNGSTPDVVLQATSGSSKWETELTAIREHTDAPVVLLSSSKSDAVLEGALEADVADVLLLPQLVENVAFAIRKAGRGRHWTRDERAPEDERGWMVTVFSPKGGTGKTVVATNLAATLAKDTSKKTLLIDLDLQFGDAAIMLGAEPETTIHDLVATPGELDSEKLAGFITKTPVGLDLVAAPLRPEDAEFVTESKLGPLLEVARQSYDTIVVDTSPFFHGAMLTTLDQTDELLLICGAEVPTLKNAHLALRTLSLLSFPTERIKLVLNHAHVNGGLKRKEIEDALGLKVAFEIPNDPAVLTAINRGQPAVLGSSNKDEFARAVSQVAQSLRTTGTGQHKRRWLPGRGRA
jgi:pilus assembly protein CpaE